MQSIILNGVNASGQWYGSPGLAFELRGIQMDIPLDEVGNSDPTITLSGAVTGAYSFHHSTNVTLRFSNNEDVYITTANFSGDYNGVVNYLQVGDMTSYMQTDKTRRARGELMTYPTPWRFR